jgi:DNA-binding beta-propeller fold protein YncE
METYSFVHKWGGFGASAGLFNDPFAVSIDRHGHVFVAELWNHRIQRFTLDGKFQLEWGQMGNAEGDFTNPLGVFVDCDRDEVYVSDRYRIQVFDSNGNYVRKWGSPGQGNGQLNFPMDMPYMRSSGEEIFSCFGTSTET